MGIPLEALEVFEDAEPPVRCGLSARLACGGASGLNVVEPLAVLVLLCFTAGILVWLLDLVGSETVLALWKLWQQGDKTPYCCM